jgi:hypothetical protein
MDGTPWGTTQNTDKCSGNRAANVFDASPDDVSDLLFLGLFALNPIGYFALLDLADPDTDFGIDNLVPRPAPASPASGPVAVGRLQTTNRVEKIIRPL